VIKFKSINFKSGIPLYIQIKDYIREKIEIGELKIADKIPSEDLLCEKFDVSKITVIRALRDLVNEGIILRKQGKGSFVNKTEDEEDLNIVANFNKIYTWPSAVAKHKILKWQIVTPSTEILEKAKLPEGSSVLEIIRLRYYKEEPVTLEYTYLPESACQYFKDKRKYFESKYVYDIFKMIPNILLDSSKICIKSRLADGYQAKILKINTGEPLLFWERVTLTEDKKVIEISKFFTRGDKYSYYVEFYKNKNVKNILTNNIDKSTSCGIKKY